MKHRKTDAEYIKRLERTIDQLETENERLRAESARYLNNWVAAQDLTSYRNLQLMLAK